MNLVPNLRTVLLLVCTSLAVSAFTPSVTSGKNGIRISGYDCGLILGPVARNGLGYEDIVIGTGRRILPGDTVACYYTGSFKKGPMGKPTIFDSIGTFGLRSILIIRLDGFGTRRF
jgi:hypothetical protein